MAHRRPGGKTETAEAAEAADLEVITTTVADGVAAEQGGADRLEVVAAMEHDGLLPDLALVCRLRDAVSIPMRVMLRCTPGFTTGGQDLAALCRAAERLRAAGVDQFVFGFLTEDAQLDRQAIRTLYAAASPAAWTFHRAFDHAADAEAAFAQCAALPRLDRILSAGSPGGIDSGRAVLRQRAAWQTPALRWLAGGGLRRHHIPALRTAGITHFHAGRAVRRDQRWSAPVEASLVRQLKDALLEPLPSSG